MKPVLRCFQISLLAVLLSGAAMAQWEAIGDVKPAERKGNEFTFRSIVATVVIQVLAADLIRVRAVHATSLSPDHSYAVVKTDWPSVTVGTSCDGKYQAIRTAQLEVRVQLSPFRIAFYDAGGALLSKDSDTQGMAWNRNRVRVWKWEPPDEHYFGFGEKSTPLDKRGRSLVMWNHDPEGFDASSEPLYESVPFFVALRRGRAYGIFLDNTWRSSFDMGSELPDIYSFGAEGGELNYYFFGGPDPKQVVGRFTELVGRIALPPRWALGYIQSRYSYYPESMVRFIAENFRHRQIPCDGIFLDIDYMDGYRVFTWDKTRFPDPKRMVTDLRQQGFHTIAIVDPMVKVDPDYSIYKQGRDNNYFVKRADGTILTGKGWAADNAYPDFASPTVRDWWAELFKEQLDAGVAAYLTDMNEPVVMVKEGPAGTFDLDAVHQTEMGPRSHAEIHNVYGMLETEATREGMLRARPNERPFIITRATFAGGQRYAAQWSGDNYGTWDHLRLSVPMLNGMGLSGLQFVGADIGGIVPVPSPELYTRWMQTGLLTPFSWTHSLGPGNLEPWGFGNRMETINRESIKLRYRLLPYIYTEFWQATQTGQPIMRPLLLDYPDDSRAIGTNDEYLFGNDLLVAPVVKDYDESRSVYLPRGTWYDYWTDRRYVGPLTVEVNAPLDRMPLFVRGGAILPSQQDMQYTDQFPIDPLTFDVYPDASSSREYYDDDGISFAYRNGAYLRQRLTVESAADRISIEISNRQGTYQPPKRSIVVKVHLQPSEPRALTLRGVEIPRHASAQVLRESSKGWAYDIDSNTTWIKFPDEEVGVRIVLVH